MSDPENNPCTDSGPEEPKAPRRWRTLPAPIPPEQMTTEQPSHDAPDPEMGRDANQEWMLKYG